MWDLIDNRNEFETFPGSGRSRSRLLSGNGSIRINDINDNCNISNGNNQFDLSPIFSVLENQTEDACDLYYRLINNHPNELENLWFLFRSYGFTCGGLP